MFSIGRLVVSTPIGWICDTYRHRIALLVSGAILTVGAFLWANVLSFNSIIPLYIAQFLLGLGTGSLGVTRAYVSEQTKKEERTNALSLLTAIQYAGFAVTPLFGAMLILLGRNVSTTEAIITPAIFIFFISLICLILLIHPFKDLEYFTEEITTNNQYEILQQYDVEKSSTTVVDEMTSASTSSTSSRNTTAVNDEGKLGEEDEEEKEGKDSIIQNIAKNKRMEIFEITSEEIGQNNLEPYLELSDNHRYWILALMVLLNFSTRGAVAIYETQISSILLDDYQLSQTQFGLIISIAGMIGTMQLIFFKQIWTNYWSDYSLMVFGLIIMSFAQGFVIDWGPNYHKPIWMLILAIGLVYSLGYPVANTAVLGCFSKLQKTKKQGLMQSLFALVGSLARVCMPVLSGYFEKYVEENSSFGLAGILMAISLIGTAYFQTRIIRASSTLSEDQLDFKYLRDILLQPDTDRWSSQQIIMIVLCLLLVGAIIGSMLDWGVAGW
jgi:MFS family permease